MTVHDLFTDLRCQGFTLAPLSGGKLEVKPWSKLTDALREAITHYKPELLAALSGVDARRSERETG